MVANGQTAPRPRENMQLLSFCLAQVHSQNGVPMLVPKGKDLMKDRTHLLHKARVDVVHQVVDLLQLLFVPVREGELGIRIPALHNCAGVDAILPERVRNVELPEHLQQSLYSWVLLAPLGLLHEVRLRPYCTFIIFLRCKRALLNKSGQLDDRKSHSRHHCKRTHHANAASDCGRLSDNLGGRS